MIIPDRITGEQVLVKLFVLIPFAALIWIFEKLGWICDVRWTNPARLARITAGTHRTGDGDAPVRETTQELTS